MENISNTNNSNEVINLDEIDEILKDGSSNMDNCEIDLTDDGVKIENGNKENNVQSENMMGVDVWDNLGLESEDDEEAAKRDLSYISPEDVERALLNMPTSKQLNEDINHLKHVRKLTASPLSVLDLSDSHVIELISWSSLHDYQTSFVRDQNNLDTFKGVLTMAFTTCKSAEKAVEHLKAWNADLDVKIDNHSHRSVESFFEKNGLRKKWTDNVAVLKNLSAEVTKDAILDLFPAVEDIVFHLDMRKKNDSPPRKVPSTATDSNANTDPQVTSTDPQATSMAEVNTSAPIVVAPSESMETNTDDGKSVVPSQSRASVLPSAPPKGFAYLVFQTEEIMNDEVEASRDRRLMLCGHKLILLAYKAPVHAIPRSYLRLRERKAVFTYIERCESKLESLKEDLESKAIPILQEKIKQSRVVIENDDQSRKDLGLPQPTSEELKTMNGLLRLNSPLILKTLTRYGIIKKKSEDSNNNNGSSGKKRFKNSPSRYNRGNRRNNSPSHKGGRRSPYRRHNNTNNRRNYGAPYSRGRSNNRNNQPTSLLGNAALANPIAQLVMQQNLLGAVGLNTGGMGGGGYPGGAPMDGLLGNPFKAAVNPQQLIRLDETGNFRLDNESSYYNDNPGPARNNDFRRQSHSPRNDYGRVDNTGVGGSMVGPGLPSGGVAGDDSVNLLLNLSQMLSNKMDQKRQQLEHDKRSNYNNNNNRNRRFNDY